MKATSAPKQAGEDPRAGCRIEETTATTSTAVLSGPRPNDLLVTHGTMRQADRLQALQTEIKLLGQIALESPLAGIHSTKRQSMLRQASLAAMPKRRGGRFRLPRKLKQRLIDSLCSDPADSGPAPTTAIIVAHPDDESIGAGSRLLRLDNAAVVHVTDGAPADPAVTERYGFSSREEYAAARREEVERALAFAGVPPERIICLGYVDGQASLRLVDLCMKVAEVLDQLRPEVVITHPYEGGHTDHDATAFAVHMACGLLLREGVPVPAILELTSYHSRSGVRTVHEFLPHAGADREQRVIVLADADQLAKKRMYEAFTSQHEIVSTFSTAIEKFRPAPRYVFTRAPHNGVLNYERYPKGLNGAEWRRQAANALQTLRVRKKKSAA